MIRCYKCQKELHEVKEIGEIIRSYDGEDFCFCQKCQTEFEEEDREYLSWLESTESQ